MRARLCLSDIVVTSASLSLRSSKKVKPFKPPNVCYGSFADISEPIRMSALPPKADMLNVGVNVC